LTAIFRWTTAGTLSSPSCPVAPPFNVGFPSWEDDPEFDIRRHVKEVRLKRGTETELKQLAGKLLSTVMDRRHPLWDVTVVHGLRGNRAAMVIRLHHCLADGIAGLALMNVLLDTHRDVRPVAAGKPRVTQPQRDSLSLLLEGCISSYSELIERVLRAQSDFTGALLQTLGGAWPNDEFAKYLPELTAPTERLFFNKVYQGPQGFAWAQIPTDAIKRIRKSCNATHNDVVLALMTATIRRYAELHGENMKGRLFRMTVPVNVRFGEDGSELGNRILFLPVTVPFEVRGARKLLEAVHERTDFLKRSHVAEWVGLAAGLLGVVPAPLQALVGPLASTLPLALCNMICTNIRGPDEPLYFLGRKMIEWYPYVPVGGQMTLNCAVLSYCEVTYFGFSGDIKAAPDLRKLEALLHLSAAELLKTSRLEPRRTKPRKAKKRTPIRRKSSVVQASAPESEVPLPASTTSPSQAERRAQEISAGDAPLTHSSAAD